jgi:aspartyl-tRNA synthetase
MTYKEAQEKYGSDKPDTRYGMEIIDLSDTVKESGFSVFRSAIESGGSVRAIVAENSASVLSRKELDRLTEYAKGIGAKGLAYIKPSENETACSFHKFVSPDEINAIIEKTGAKNGDTVLIIADQNNSHVLTQLGSLRILLARKLNIIPENRYDLLWIVEFPFFEFDEESGTWVAMHHPFTAPLDECIPYLETDKSKVRAKCYDLVLNGTELCSGSIRITNPDLQDRIFKLLGLNEEEAQQKFGFLMEAFKYGAPPHGGMALGLDRIAMILCGKDNLRDVVAYPKVQNMSELMTMSPSPIEDKQLEELGICLRQKNTEGKAE